MMITTSESQSLLREYVSSHSGAVFRRIVEAHAPLVFSAAMRAIGGDIHMAQDIAQTTFSSLAQQARHLSPEVILSAWLYRHACLTARHYLRADARRRARESAAALMNEPAHDPWPAIAPVLDDAMAALSGSDRTALVLRYFENQDLRTVGHTPGLTDGRCAKTRVPGPGAFAGLAHASWCCHHHGSARDRIGKSGGFSGHSRRTCGHACHHRAHGCSRRCCCAHR